MSPPPPPTYFVVCFHEKCCQEAVNFISDRLAGSTLDGGAGLVIHQEPMRPDGLILHVSASNDNILQLAETIGVKKRDSNGVIRDFEAAQNREFPQNGVVGPLALSDVHRCVMHAMESLHFEKTRHQLPGHPSCKVMKQAPILSAYREEGFIDTFPLHDQDALDVLKAKLDATSIFKPPLEDIRSYFGENMALYFSFMSFYTAFLIPIAVIGITQFVVDRMFGIDVLYSNVFFAAVNLVGVTVFLELWKRRNNEHSYTWGTGGKLRHKAPRPEYRGEIGLNKITGKEEMQYPVKMTIQKMVFVSIPLTLLCLLGAFILMLGSFEAERITVAYLTDPETGLPSTGLVATVLGFVPSVSYTILVLVLNLYYLKFSHYLTEWENHRTQEQFEKHAVSKLILFEFVNTFLATFYIGFYLQDVAMLKSTVSTMLVVSQIVNQLQETLVPIFLRRPSTRRMFRKISKKFKDFDKEPLPLLQCEHSSIERLPQLTPVDFQVVMANYNLKRDPYESTYDDFMELWLQFGHVFLFSSVYPLAGCLALVNNLFEIKMDVYKLCKLTRKPTPRAVRDLGAWYAAFSVTSAISVMTNCVLLSMDKDVQAFMPDASQRDWILLWVGIEHVFLLVRMAINVIIPDVTKKIKESMDRDEWLLRKRAD